MDENQVSHSIVGDAKQSWAEKKCRLFLLHIETINEYYSLGQFDECRSWAILILFLQLGDVYVRKTFS